ncbi:MAG: hypothetical protein ACXWEG_05025 [Actinomycetota bacterium]
MNAVGDSDSSMRQRLASALFVVALAAGLGDAMTFAFKRGGLIHPVTLASGSPSPNP